jgi:hypothetical protein
MKSERAPGTKKRKRGWNPNSPTAKTRTAITEWFGKDSHEVTLFEINDMMHNLFGSSSSSSSSRNKTTTVIYPKIPNGMTRHEAQKLIGRFQRLKTNLISAQKSRNHKKKRIKRLEVKAREYDSLVQRISSLEKDLNLVVLETQKLRYQLRVISDWVGASGSAMIPVTEQEKWFSSMILL